MSAMVRNSLLNFHFFATGLSAGSRVFCPGVNHIRHIRIDLKIKELFIERKEVSRDRIYEMLKRMDMGRFDITFKKLLKNRLKLK